MEGRQRVLLLVASVSEKKGMKSSGRGVGGGGQRLKEMVSNSDCGEFGGGPTGGESVHRPDSGIREGMSPGWPEWKLKVVYTDGLN